LPRIAELYNREKSRSLLLTSRKHLSGGGSAKNGRGGPRRRHAAGYTERRSRGIGLRGAFEDSGASWPEGGAGITNLLLLRNRLSLWTEALAVKKVLQSHFRPPGIEGQGRESFLALRYAMGRALTASEQSVNILAAVGVTEK